MDNFTIRNATETLKEAFETREELLQFFEEEGIELTPLMEAVIARFPTASELLEEGTSSFSDEELREFAEFGKDL